jgi:sugar lactone lactonase YvrE
MATQLTSPEARACRGAAERRSPAKRTLCLCASVPLCLLSFPIAVPASAAEPSFATKPSAAKAGDGFKLSFAVSAPTDAEVSILGADGRVVRHLAAGMLGKNAPEPFKKDSLAQEVVWDGKDDAGKPVAGGAKARVRIGMGAELDRMIPPEPDPLSPPTAIGVGANGDVYVLANRYMTGGVYIFVLDRQGKYLRTILPSPSTLKAAQVKGLERLKLPGGKEVPIIYGGYTSDTGPFLSGFRSQRLEVTSQGWIVMASGANDMWDQTVPRHVLIIKPDGTTPEETGFVGPNLGPKSGYGSGVREQQLAASPDGKTLYFAGMGMSFKTPKGIHCVGKLGFDSKGPETFIGKPDEPGADGEHLNAPETVSTDSQGNLLVADLGNNRVAVFSPDGKFQGETKVDNPKYICVHPKTGAMYVSTHPGEIKAGKPRPFSVIKFDKAAGGKEVARLDLSGKDPVLALDPGAEPARLWLANGGLFPITDGGGKLELGADVIKPVAGGLVSPLYMCADPARARLYVADFRLNVLAVDLKTGQSRQFAKASEPAVDREGNVYVLDAYGSNSLSRYSSDGKPLPFATGGNKLAIKFRNGLPNVGVKGLTVAPDGDIFAYQDNNTAGGMHVWQFGPDGKLKREDFVKDIPPDSGTGLAADRAGNVYVGINIHDPKGFYPSDFGDQIPQLAWYTPYDPKKTSWYARPQHGLPEGPPWNRPYLNFYLYQYGSVFKFGPEGGKLYGGGAAKKDGNGARPEGVPADAREYRNAYLGQTVWLSGAKWEYRGFGICANRTENWGDPGCSCMSSRFGIDEHDRLFIPDVFRFSIGVVDTAGNEMARIGAYGNVDSAGPKSLIPEPAIPLAAPNAVAAGGGKVYVADRKSRRIVVINLKFAAEESCEVR